MSVGYPLYIFIEKVHSAFGSDPPVATILSLDVSRAFDDFQYKRLIHNLKKGMCPRGIVAFIKHFLRDRTTKIKVQGIHIVKLRHGDGHPPGISALPYSVPTYNPGLVELNINAERSFSLAWVGDVSLVVKRPTAQQNARR